MSDFSLLTVVLAIQTEMDLWIFTPEISCITDYFANMDGSINIIQLGRSLVCFALVFPFLCVFHI